MHTHAQRSVPFAAWSMNGRTRVLAPAVQHTCLYYNKWSRDPSTEELHTVCYKQREALPIPIHALL